MPPAFILSQDQTLHCKKSDRAIKARFIGSTYSDLGGFPWLAPGSLTLDLFAFALRCSISKERGPFSGRREINLHPFSAFANRFAVFLGIFVSFFRISSISIQKVSFTTNHDYVYFSTVLLTKPS